MIFGCGHFRTPENSIRVGWLASGEPKLACRQCKRLNAARAASERYDERKAAPTAWVVEACR